MIKRKSFGLPCPRHSQEQLTNFCKHPQCLLPLCPSCIQSHAQLHHAVPSPSDIDSIDLVIAAVRGHNLARRRSALEVGERLARVQQDFQRLASNIREQLQDSKALLLSEVCRTIDRVEQNLLSELQGLTQKRWFKMVQLDQRLRGLIAQTFQVQDELAGPSFLKQLVNFHQGPREIKCDVIEKELDKLAEESVTLRVEEQLLDQVKGQVQRMFRLEVGERRKGKGRERESLGR